MEWRKSCVENLLDAANISRHEIEICVDIGGGEGGVIPDLPNSKKYILDSNKNLRLPSDILQINDMQDLRKINPDFIMCCGLLEHLNNPSNFLEDLISNTDSTTIFYFEVPFGVPKFKKTLITSQKVLNLISSNKLIWNFALKIDKFLNMKSNLRPLPLKISEHLNFFTESGLNRLLNSSGFEVLKLQIFHTNFALPDSANVGFEYGIQALVKKITS
jgi:hypothetical protein